MRKVQPPCCRIVASHGLSEREVGGLDPSRYVGLQQPNGINNRPPSS